LLFGRQNKCWWRVQVSSDSKSKNRMGEVQGMWRAVVWEKIFVKDERKDLSDLCKIGYVVWQRNMVHEGEGYSNLDMD